MCRLAAFPPGFERSHAMKILANFARGNSDGTGSVYVEDGEFVVNKWPLPISKVVNRKYPLLDHMPHDGWTVVHLRAASHGANTMQNTHPFIKGEWAISHNGIWSDYEVVKAALKPFVEFEGETDSEVAAQVLVTVGPKKFAKLIDFGGVYLALNQNGELWVAKTSGELETTKLRNGTILLASELPDVWEPEYQADGWMHLDSDGTLIDQAEYRGYSRGPSCAFDPPGMMLSKKEETKPKFGHAW